MVSDLQVFRDTVSHRRPERILYKADFTPDLHRRVAIHVGALPADAGLPDTWTPQQREQAGAAIQKHFGYWQCVGVGGSRPANVPPPDFSKYWKDEKLPEGTRINSHGVAMVPSGFYHFWGYISPLRSATSISEIEQYPMQDYSTWDFTHIAGEVAKAHADGKVTVGWVGHMYETAWQIRGYEQFLMDLIERPAWAECLLERIFRNNLHAAVQMARAGVDYLLTGDDVANQNAMMFSPTTWRELFHSRWAKVWRAVKEANAGTLIWYHSDGNILAIIGDLVDAGLDILNPLQPECLDIDEVYRNFGQRLSFDGCMGTQSTMPWGTPQQVKDRVAEVIDKYGRHGGLIISPTHVLEPEVPIANIEAMAQVCREYKA